jgi:hypothetical protein
MMDRRFIALLLLTLPLPVIWWVAEGYNDKVDLFLFQDFEQKAKWYVHYSAYHLDNIIKTYLIYFMASKFISKKAGKIALIFLFLSVYRLAEYWLFRNHIPHLPVIGVVLFSMIKIWKAK